MSTTPNDVIIFKPTGFQELAMLGHIEVGRVMLVTDTRKGGAQWLTYLPERGRGGAIPFWYRAPTIEEARAALTTRVAAWLVDAGLEKRAESEVAA